MQQKKLTLNSARTVLAHVSVCLADKNVPSTAGTWNLTLANTWTEAKISLAERLTDIIHIGARRKRPRNTMQRSCGRWLNPFGTNRME